MLYLVFRSVGDFTTPRDLPPGYCADLWRPGLRRVVPPTLGLKFSIWWLLHHLHIFRSRKYSAILIRYDGEIVHRTCLVPKYFRWAFMADDDLQVSSTWTHPGHRCRGLASYALYIATERWANKGRTLWYVTRDENAPSLAVCRKVGFQLLTEGNRILKFGSRLLGQLVLVQKPPAKG